MLLGDCFESELSALIGGLVIDSVVVRLESESVSVANFREASARNCWVSNG
jgi:hypothetical protein